MYDVLIIGAGIIGSFIAHDLSKYQLSIALLDKANDVANGATMANSAIIHAGHDPIDGTLKAKLNVLGNQMYEGICKELNCSFERIGAFVVACNEEELVKLDELYKQAIKRAIPVSYVSKEEMQKLEPNISDMVIKGISLPSTGIIYPWEVAIALVENAMDNGVELYLNNGVEAIKSGNGYFEVKTNNGLFKTKSIINAAGVYADDIYNLVSDKRDFEITPRKGEYFVLDKLKEPLVTRVIYPLPSAKGKGVLVVPTTHSNILLGPNSDFVDNKEGVNNTLEALNYVKSEVSRTVKNIPMAKIIRTFAGLRPTGSKHDFIIEEASDVPMFFNVAAIESPGLASAPAISKYLIDNYISKKLELVAKHDYNPYRRPYIDLKALSKEERDEYVKRDPRFANIICRCEQISEGEIIDAINRNCGATTIKGVKKRVRPGMGRCQGGFCEPLVVDILARELNKDRLDILMDSPNSKLLVERTKE